MIRASTTTTRMISPTQIARPIARIPEKKSGGGAPPFDVIPTCTVTGPVGATPVPFTLSMITVTAPVADVNVPPNCWRSVRLVIAWDASTGSARYIARPEGAKKNTSMFDPVTTWIAYTIDLPALSVNVYPMYSSVPRTTLLSLTTVAGLTVPV